VVNFGFAGGVLPGVAVADLVLAQRVLTLEKGCLSELERPEPELARKVAGALAAGPFRLQLGTFITAGGITGKGELARLLGGTALNPVLEMETGGVLQAASRRGIPAVAIRGVSDAADEELGFSLEEFCDGDLNLRLAQVLGTVLRKPRIIPELIRLSGNSRRAGRTLAAALEISLRALSLG